VVLTIAMGLGVTAAICSLVCAILLRPVLYPRAEELVRVSTVLTAEQGAERNCSLLDGEDYNRRAKRMKILGGYTSAKGRRRGRELDGHATEKEEAELKLRAA
jgi:hypothetical protein